MKDLFEEINKDLQNYTGTISSLNRVEKEVCNKHKPMPSLSVFNSEIRINTPIRHMTKESLNFLCFLRMTDILRRISSYTHEELLEMWTSCRDLYKENQIQLDYIDQLENTYDESEVIQYYTGNSCLSRTINQACHTENMKQIFTFRVFISDLHKQLVQCHKQDENNDLKSSILRVYRGKPLSGSVLQQLVDNVGGLISMNGFLSTTVARKAASHFHGDDEVTKSRVGYRPVLFVFKINTTIKQPYAYIGNCSTKPDEAEVLFSLGTIWRIESVKIDKDPCIVELTSYDESDLQSTKILKKYTEEGCDLSSIGDILLKLGDDDQAEWFYGKMLKQASLDVETEGSLYYKIGKIRFEKNDYSVALEKLKKAADLLPSSTNKLDEIIAPRPQCLCDDQSPFITMYTNMGIMHEKDCQFKEAINCYKEAVKIKNESKVGVATAHNYLGLLYYRLGKYEEAREHHMKAMELVDEGDSNWIEFQRNLNKANERCQHLTNMC
jgi:tetratricopeptide (TPR) repeat protein